MRNGKVCFAAFTQACPTRADEPAPGAGADAKVTEVRLSYALAKVVVYLVAARMSSIVHRSGWYSPRCQDCVLSLRCGDPATSHAPRGVTARAPG